MFCLIGFKMSYVLFHPCNTKLFPNLKCCYIISYRSYGGVCTHLKIIKYWLLKICSSHIAKPQIKSFSPWKLFFSQQSMHGWLHLFLMNLLHSHCHSFLRNLTTVNKICIKIWLVSKFSLPSIQGQISSFYDTKHAWFIIYFYYTN